jgi:proline iminopeptidase
MRMNRREFLYANAAGALSLAAPLSAGASTAPAAAKSHEVMTGGARMIAIDGGKYRVWTKRIGHGRIKLLTLHGGPGFNHEYLECFEDFLPAAGIELYYYDQLGSSYSDQPSDDSLWMIPRFVEEVEQVRAALGLEQFYLFGHSWGGMLGIEYALKYGQHLKGFILSNMTAGIRAYEKHAAELKAALPAETIAKIDKYEAAGDYGNADYQQLMMTEVYGRYLCRLDPWPEPLDRSFRHLNDQIYNLMQGPNEFVITGTMKNWERWDDLPHIKVPTQVIGARHDTMSLDDLKREAELIPNARLGVCAEGSHMAMYDDQAAYFGHLLGFVHDVERGRRMK